MQIRTFIALEVPEAPFAILKEQLRKWKNAFPNGINWVKPENLHLTLLFIGDTPRDSVPRLISELSTWSSSITAAELELLGYELFPAHQPRLLLAKLDTHAREVFTYPKQLCKIAYSLHLKPDTKPLKLHITMGRIKSMQTPEQERNFMQTPLPHRLDRYDKLSLFQSSLRPEGPTYTALETFNLKY